MAKLERKNFKVFGENAPLDEIGQFGSAKATTKKNTKDIEEIQELDAWSEGWGGAVISNKNYPPMEEMTGAMNVMSYQTAYTLQEGIPEWNKDTTYYKGSIVKNLEGEDVKLYQSINNDNLNNSLSNTDNWKEINFGGSGLPLLFIGQSLYIDESLGLDRYLNGQIVYITENYKPALQALQSLASTHPSLFDTEENWQAAKTLSAFGQVGKFVFNYADDGETVVSVRIPAIVNVQGLFDLQNLGLTVAESLPNITGTLNCVNIGAISQDWNGALSSSYDTVGSRATGVSPHSTLNFDASRSSSTYQDDAPVQQEAVQYPYFIRLATGVENEVNITNKFENTNPQTLLESKYSDKPLYNESWLLSNGQWNSKGMYPTVYEGLEVEYNSEIEAGTTVTLPSGISYTKRGLSVKLSTEEYDDYDFVLNTADETFRLPLLDGSEDLPSERYIDLTLDTSGSTYTAPANGWFGYYANSAGCTIYHQTTGLGSIANYIQNFTGCKANVFVKKGDIIKLYYTESTDYIFQFIYAQGNGSLYYYVGDIDKNHGIVDMGRIGEDIANIKGDLLTKTDKAQVTDYSSPSETYVSLTFAADAEYVAPADGWFTAHGSFNEGGFGLRNSSGIGNSCVGNSGNLNYGWSSVRVTKGQVVKAYYRGGTVSWLRFVYAKGAI